MCDGEIDGENFAAYFNEFLSNHKEVYHIVFLYWYFF